MADAGFTHAAVADIPNSATSRRGMLPALAGLAVGLAYAVISVYWAGGRWLLNTVGISLSQPGQAGHLAALLAVWGAAAVSMAWRLSGEELADRGGDLLGLGFQGEEVGRLASSLDTMLAVLLESLTALCMAFAQVAQVRGTLS
jgi:hypothetical protein